MQVTNQCVSNQSVNAQPMSSPPMLSISARMRLTTQPLNELIVMSLAFSNRVLVSLMLFITILLTGCGYQLQKPLSVEINAQPIYIEGDLLLSIALKRQLVAEGLLISNKRSSANSTITLNNVDFESRNFSVSDEGKNAETQRNMSAGIKWKYNSENTENDTGSRTLLPYSTVTTEIVQVKNLDNVAAQQSESDLLLREARDEIAEKMVQLIRYYN